MNNQSKYMIGGIGFAVGFLVGFLGGVSLCLWGLRGMIIVLWGLWLLLDGTWQLIHWLARRN